MICNIQSSSFRSINATQFGSRNADLMQLRDELGKHIPDKFIGVGIRAFNQNGNRVLGLGIVTQTEKQIAETKQHLLENNILSQLDENLFVFKRNEKEVLVNFKAYGEAEA